MKLREQSIKKLDDLYDVLVIGGGINGAVAAASLAGKGAKVALIDKGDFAGFTSQQSSNLAWGGIKYMETFEFGLVRKLCMSRNHLIRNYPSTVKEIRFLTTHPKGFRHGLWKLYLGTWLYWLIGNGFTKPPKFFTKKMLGQEEGVLDLSESDGGFEYSDAYFHDNDSRFVFNFIRSAMDFGCVAANYVESKGGKKNADGIWETQCVDLVNNKEITIKSKAVVNACGPFVDQYNENIQQKTEHQHVFSKGIHLIVDRITEHKRILTFFSLDGRLFFVIPMGNRTCIGTTDTRMDSMHSQVTQEDQDFVLENINHLLKLDKPLTENDVIATRCGVRPLVIKGQGDGEVDWLQLSRKHAVEVDRNNRWISIFGGKLTDCLNVGEEICEEVTKFGIALPQQDRIWYGEDREGVKSQFDAKAQRMALDALTDPDSSEQLSSRLWRRYGKHALEMLEEIEKDPKMAEVLIKGTEYLRCEIKMAAKREMITKLDDFLRRRSKISLVVSREKIKNSPGIMEACEIIFGDEAQQKFDEYFQTELAA